MNMVSPVPAVDPATAMFCGGTICVTVLLVAAILSILVSCGISTGMAWLIFKKLGFKIGKK